MKSLNLFLSIFFVLSSVYAADTVSYSAKFTNFDGSVTYDNPRAAFAGYWLRPSEVYKAQQFEYFHQYGDYICKDYSEKVSKTALNLCVVLGHSKLVGSVNEDIEKWELNKLFVSTKSGDTGVLSSIDEYKTEYNVYGKDSIGRPYVHKCNFGAVKVVQITCKQFKI